ncbi:hypothetical protein B0H65DRAFT_470867 [Neurospora tetraspora]|uniref:Uncharacterized protein n=1 Tax=Neurospora tetraspora TaxID=94610 RepID=A0AAE0JF23_9PEZI|nr:hypothetical protein B0H65DRAFT_470867 [Neurospora tetraspora]
MLDGCITDMMLYRVLFCLGLIGSCLFGVGCIVLAVKGVGVAYFVAYFLLLSSLLV